MLFRRVLQTSTEEEHHQTQLLIYCGTMFCFRHGHMFRPEMAKTCGHVGNKLLFKNTFVVLRDDVFIRVITERTIFFSSMLLHRVT